MYEDKHYKIIYIITLFNKSVKNIHKAHGMTNILKNQSGMAQSRVDNTSKSRTNNGEISTFI